MPQAVSSDILEPGIGGRLRPKSGRRTRLKWIDQAPPQHGASVPIPGRPVGALAEYGLSSESDEDDENDGSKNPPPLVEIARTMSTVFDVRKHSSGAAATQTKPKKQEQPSKTAKAVGDSSSGPRAGLSPVTIPPLDMGRIEGAPGAGPSRYGHGGCCAHEATTADSRGLRYRVMRVETATVKHVEAR